MHYLEEPPSKSRILYPRKRYVDNHVFLVNTQEIFKSGKHNTVTWYSCGPSIHARKALLTDSCLRFESSRACKVLSFLEANAERTCLWTSFAGYCRAILDTKSTLFRMSPTSTTKYPVDGPLIIDYNSRPAELHLEGIPQIESPNLLHRRNSRTSLENLCPENHPIKSRGVIFHA